MAHDRQTLDEFRTALVAEERTVSDVLAQDKLGILLRAAVNEFDWYFYNLSRAADPTPDQEQQFYILQLGINRLIKLALDSRPAFDVPVVLFRRDRRLTLDALQLLSTLGLIEHGRRVADSVATGLGAITRRSDRSFDFHIPQIVVDEEHDENALKEHYNRESQRIFDLQQKTRFAKKLRKRAWKLLTKNVYTWQTHFIGYEADPFLDHYFFALGYNKLQSQEGFDTFHYALEFGGIKFQKYIVALAYFLGLALKHEAFCEALIQKEKSVRLENILTITCDHAPFLESLVLAMNEFGSRFESHTLTDLEEAKTILSVLSIHRQNTTLLSRPAATIPSAVVVSDSGFIRSIAGAQTNPVLFLLSSLKEKFPDDYNRHQATREKSMQRAIQRVLNDRIEGLEYRQNIKLRHDGRDLTDLDLVIIDTREDVVVLCQLKVQDPYGADFKARGTRTGRLKKEVGHWLTATRSWLKRADEMKIRQTLQLDRKFTPRKFWFMTVTRHYAFALKDVSQDQDTVFATWLQLVNTVEVMHQRGKGARLSLGELCGLLRKHVVEAKEKTHLEEPNMFYHLSTMEFAVRRVPDAATPEGAEIHAPDGAS